MQNDLIEAESNTTEWQVYGPPGTGKTTYLARQIPLAAKKFGSESILVASFTTAASAELVSRNLPIRKEQVRTLHAHAYNAIGKPKILETTKDLLAQWSKKNPKFAMVKVDTDIDNPLDDGYSDESTLGLEMLSKYNLMRAKRIQTYPSHTLQDFAAKWEAFKKDTSTIDFTDMIEFAIERIPYAPGQPAVIFIDEAQDMTPLEWELCRKWGGFAEKLIVSGDDDQCIYGFKGADAATFYAANLPEQNKYVLKQSYRVPQAVHRVANRWVERLTHRQVKEYQPRVDADGKPVVGECRWYARANFNEPKFLLEDMQQYLAKGKSVMVLASCAYMLNKLKEDLRHAGLPFQNKYRRKRGDWNPLGQGKSIKAMLSFLAPMLHGWRMQNNAESWQKAIDAKLWTLPELQAWVDVMSVSTFLKHGCGTEIDEAELAPSSYELLQMLDMPEDFIKIVNGDLAWFKGHLQKANRSKFEYICRIVEKHTAAALKMEPPITIGTIHSVKGGEADAVYLMPDIAKRAYDNFGLDEVRDEIIRQFYVGMTRCKETLVILAPGSGYYIKGLNNFIRES